MSRYKIQFVIIGHAFLIASHNMKCLPQREATIVYATHIFDGLETWATDFAYIQEGELRRSGRYSDIEELKSAKNLLSVVESWLRSETKLPKKELPRPETQARRSSPLDASPFRSSRHMAYYR